MLRRAASTDTAAAPALGQQGRLKHVTCYSRAASTACSQYHSSTTTAASSPPLIPAPYASPPQPAALNPEPSTLTAFSSSNQGRLIEEGTHAQLLAEGGAYSELVSKQLEGQLHAASESEGLAPARAGHAAGERRPPQHEAARAGDPPDQRHPLLACGQRPRAASSGQTDAAAPTASDGDGHVRADTCTLPPTDACGARATLGGREQDACVGALAALSADAGERAHSDVPGAEAEEHGDATRVLLSDESLLEADTSAVEVASTPWRIQAPAPSFSGCRKPPAAQQAGPAHDATGAATPRKQPSVMQANLSCIGTPP